MKKIIIIGCLSVVVVVAIIFGVNYIHSDNVIEKLSESVVLLEVYDDEGEIVATGSGFFIYDDKTIKMLRMYYLIDISTISELKISDKVINNIDYFINTYYDRYTGLYLKSKNFLKTLAKL